MLTLLTNPQISDDNKWKEWRGTVFTAWDEYVSLLFNVPVDSKVQSEKDKELIEYYTKVVKNSKLQMYKDKETGKLKLTGLNTLLKKD